MHVNFYRPYFIYFETSKLRHATLATNTELKLSTFPMMYPNWKPIRLYRLSSNCFGVIGNPASGIVEIIYKDCLAHYMSLQNEATNRSHHVFTAVTRKQQNQNMLITIDYKKYGVCGWLSENEVSKLLVRILRFHQLLTTWFHSKAGGGHVSMMGWNTKSLPPSSESIQWWVIIWMVTECEACVQLQLLNRVPDFQHFKTLGPWQET